MRQILFRGKRKDSNWWEVGSYSSYDTSDGISCSFINGFEYEVYPETVGQYTGMKDKNGKKIFEGDIVRTQPFSDRPYSKKAKFKQHIGVVEYYVGHFKSVHDAFEQDYEAMWRVNIKDYDGYGCCNWSAFFKCEVIGNIHDNPELLDA